jgi:hypothetical protein
LRTYLIMHWNQNYTKNFFFLSPEYLTWVLSFTSAHALPLGYTPTLQRILTQKEENKHHNLKVWAKNMKRHLYWKHADEHVKICSHHDWEAVTNYCKPIRIGYKKTVPPVGEDAEQPFLSCQEWKASVFAGEQRLKS